LLLRHGLGRHIENFDDGLLVVVTPELRQPAVLGAVSNDAVLGLGPFEGLEDGSERGEEHHARALYFAVFANEGAGGAHDAEQVLGRAAGEGSIGIL
jgi:hypothetical protein